MHYHAYISSVIQQNRTELHIALQSYSTIKCKITCQSVPTSLGGANANFEYETQSFDTFIDLYCPLGASLGILLTWQKSVLWAK